MPRSRISTGLLLVALSLQVAPVQAQDAATRQAAARDLAQEGTALLKEGKYAEAQERLHRAYELYPVPTVALYEGEALEKLGKLVEALERYQAAKLTEVPPDANSALRRAVERGAEEAARITPLIPKLTVELTGVDPRAPGIEVRVDGQPLPAAMLGVKVPVNPGGHEVVAVVDGEARPARTVILAAGQSERVVIDVTRVEAPASPSVEPAPAPAAPPAAPSPVADAGPAPSGSIQRTLGYVSLGVGGAGLALGVVSGVLMLGHRSKLEDGCAGDLCPASLEDEMDAFTTWRTVSFVGYGVGIVGVGAGVALLLTAPRGPSAEQSARVVPWVGPGEIGLTGSF